MSGIDRICGFPCPWQQFVEAVDGMPVDHAPEHVVQVGVRFNAVEFGGSHQRADDRPAGASPIASSEQVILPAERHRTDCALDRIGIEFNPAVTQKLRQTFPARERIADRLGKRAAARDTREMLFEPSPECVDNRLRFALSCRKTIRRLLASNCGFDRIKFADPAQGFLGKRRIGRLRDLIELAPRMRPARSKDDIALDGQPLEAGVAVDVENALEVLKMRHRALGLSVRREQIDSRRRLRSRPWSLLACIDPQASGLRASAARIEHRDGRVISKEMIGGKDVLAQPPVQSFKPPAGAADPARECRAFDLDAMPGKDLRLPVERCVIAIFADKHLREQRRRCKATGDRAFRRCSLHHFVADPACIFGTRGADHTEPCWHPIEHLGFALAS